MKDLGNSATTYIWREVVSQAVELMAGASAGSATDVYIKAATGRCMESKLSRPRRHMATATRKCRIALGVVGSCWKGLVRHQMACGMLQNIEGVVLQNLCTRTVRPGAPRRGPHRRERHSKVQEVSIKRSRRGAGKQGPQCGGVQTSGPNWAHRAQFCPNSVKIWSTSGRILVVSKPSLVHVGLCRAKFGRIRATFDRTGAKSWSPQG